MQDASANASGGAAKRRKRFRPDARALRTGVLGGLGFGAGLVLAFPPFDLWPATLLMPLAIAWLALASSERPVSGALGAFLGAIAAWAFQHAWVVNVSELGYPFLVMYSASAAGLTTFLLAHIVRRFPQLPLGISCALLWTLIEVFRGEVYLGGYPWHLLAHPLINVSALAAPGAVIGAYGLSALLAALAGAVVDGAVRRRSTSALATLAGVASLWTILALLPAPRPTGSVSVAIIQTNSEQDNRTPSTPWEMIQLMRSLVRHTREAALENPDFIVWPESMMPGRTLDPPSIEAEKKGGVYYKVKPPAGSGEPFELNAWDFAEGTLALQSDLGIPLIAGSESYTNLRIVEVPEGGIDYVADETFNSAFLIADGRVQGRYDKIVLTPFGEVMPGLRHWPWLEERVRALGAYGMTFDLSPGAARSVLSIPRDDAPPIRAVAPICFEATMPNACRRMVYNGPRRLADVIINGTNDGWFNSFAMARGQHLLAARWRSLELATPMARAANTGISALVDHRGRLLASGVNKQARAVGVDGVLSGELPIVNDVSLYARGGWTAPWFAALLGLILSLASFFRPRTPRNTHASPTASAKARHSSKKAPSR